MKNSIAKYYGSINDDDDNSVGGVGTATGGSNSAQRSSRNSATNATADEEEDEETDTSGDRLVAPLFR